MNEQKIQKMKELSLMLMYLSGWWDSSIREPNEKEYRVWKGFLYVVLNELGHEGLIDSFRKSKSTAMTKKGITEAKRLLVEYGIEGIDD